MKLDRLTPTDYDLHIEAEELAALAAAARCSLEPGCLGLNPVSQHLVGRFLAEYDEQATRVRSPYRGLRPAMVRLDPPVDEDYGRVMYDPF
ncbi:MAG: hypothetical protein ABIM89_07450 [Mycobacteriales bacterium]